MGENMALRSCKTNCSIEINQVMPAVERIEFTGGYKPNRAESQQIVDYCPNLKEMVCKKKIKVSQEGEEQTSENLSYFL